MAVLLAPYTNAMRLGQGFNSYTQQICVDDAVVIDPNRPENVVTNDGTTMRIMSQAAGKPSAWTRINEVVREGPVAPAILLKSKEDAEAAVSDGPTKGQAEDGTEGSGTAAEGSAATDADAPPEGGAPLGDDVAPADDIAAQSGAPAADGDAATDESLSAGDDAQGASGDVSTSNAYVPDLANQNESFAKDIDPASSGDSTGKAEDKDVDSGDVTNADADAARPDLAAAEEAEYGAVGDSSKSPAAESGPSPAEASTSKTVPALKTTFEKKSVARRAPSAGTASRVKARVRSSSVDKPRDSAAGSSSKTPAKEKLQTSAATSTSMPESTVKTTLRGEAAASEAPATGTTPQAKARARSSSVSNKRITAEQIASAKQGPVKYQVKEIPSRSSKADTAAGLEGKPAAPSTASKPLSVVEIEQAKLDKEEKLALMREEKELMAEQRKHQRAMEKLAREQQNARLLEEQKEQSDIRAEKRAYDKERRDAMQKSIKDAVAAKQDALTLEDLNKIKAQNQFADRFDGMVNSEQTYAFDPSGARGPSQTVTYSSRFIDKLSDVTEDMSISGALSIKMAKIGGSGRGSFVDSDKFKQSDLNFYISVKVTNQTLNFKDALIYNPMRSVAIGSDDFVKVYGDSFISGFQEGGEFNAIISMKVHNKAKLLDIQAEAKVALTAGPVDVTAEANVGIARTNLEMNTETTIQVSWCGGGHIKPMEQPWNILSVMQAAARFPSLVADCPQRTYAILTKYESLRSFVSLKPATYSPIQYESAKIYTDVLMDAFMSYKSLYKSLGDQISSIQSKVLEFEPWSGDDGRDDPLPPNGRGIPSPAILLANSDGKITTSSSGSSDNKAEKNAAALIAAANTSRFAASLQGLADARKSIRRQMVYIVNEVDLITREPKVATDEDHEEPFQAPVLFETRLPSTKIPDALKTKSHPLTGKRIMAKTQTEDDLEREQQEQADLANSSPAMYRMDQDLSTDETSSFDAAVRKTPTLGEYLQASRAAPQTSNGKLFSNLDFLQPDWQVESITIGMTSRGCVGSVEIIYDNGLILRKGIPAASLVKQKTMNNFKPRERITSVAIETGVTNDSPAAISSTPAGPSLGDDENYRVLSLCLYTNRGRRLLAQATEKAPKNDGSVERYGVFYRKVSTLYLDSELKNGTVKGFFGRSSNDAEIGGIFRLGIIWGNHGSSLSSTAEQDFEPIYAIGADEVEKSPDEVEKEKMTTAQNLARQGIEALGVENVGAAR